MGENYGVSFAHRLNEQCLYEEAITAANKEIARDGDDPEPLLDRAVSLAALERYLEAVSDLEAALRLDEEAQVLELDLVDDTLFGALLGEARKVGAVDVAGGLKVLARYTQMLPKGRHLDDVDVWTRRLRGDDKDAVIIKEQILDT